MKSKYSHAEWISPRTKKPARFDLVFVLCYDKKVLRGWWTGGSWDGYKDIDKDSVIGWKRVGRVEGKVGDGR